MSSACWFEGDARVAESAGEDGVELAREHLERALGQAHALAQELLRAPVEMLNSSSTPCVSRNSSSTRTASPITSGPMPSPGTTAILFTFSSSFSDISVEAKIVLPSARTLRFSST